MLIRNSLKCIKGWFHRVCIIYDKTKTQIVRLDYLSFFMFMVVLQNVVLLDGCQILQINKPVSLLAW
jgi:hypothetical protein